MEIKITNSKGKTRTEVLGQAIIRIGTDDGNDISLQSKEVSPFHLQILNFKDGEHKNRVVNLTDLPVAITLNQEAYWLGPYAYSEINNGDEVELGDFKLQFSLPIKGGQVRTSPYFKASLEFPTNVLPPETMLEGVLTLHNTGGKAGCQFKIEIEGLPEECYQIDSIPLLYPSAVEKIPFRLFHQGTAPAVGYLTFFITLSAPDKYPDHEVIVQHNIYISPYFKQTLDMIDLSVDARAMIESPTSAKKQWKTITFENIAKTNPAPIVNEPIEVIRQKEEAPIETPQYEFIEEKIESREESSTLKTDELQPSEEMPETIEEAAPIIDSEAISVAEDPIVDEQLAGSQESSSENHKGIPELNTSNLKVIRNQFEDFWEDKE